MHKEFLDESFGGTQYYIQKWDWYDYILHPDFEAIIGFFMSLLAFIALGSCVVINIIVLLRILGK